jgi:hypothetical protein
MSEDEVKGGVGVAWAGAVGVEVWRWLELGVCWLIGVLIGVTNGDVDAAVGIELWLEIGD